ncbi:MAG: RraA family protein, partial [Alphaproteobacteria bacterium]
MIEDPPLLTVRRRFARPTRAQLDAFAGVPTGFVADAMNGRGALDARIKPIGRTPASFHGVAITCHAGPADNLALFGALAHGEPGDVMVCATDGFAETAETGDLLLGMARNRGLAGFGTEGMVRDVPGIEGVGLPCFAAGVTPNSPARNGPGTVGMPVVVGGVARMKSGSWSPPRTLASSAASAALTATSRATTASIAAKGTMTIPSPSPTTMSPDPTATPPTTTGMPTVPGPLRAGEF